MGKSSPAADHGAKETAPALTHASMHAEHRQWMNDDTMWRDDIATWQKELKLAREGVAALDAAVRAHEEALRTHAAAIRGVEQDFGQHERSLADCERTGKTNDLIALAAGHRQVGERHAQQRDAHERTKKHHHAVMAQWNALLHTLGAPQ